MPIKLNTASGGGVILTGANTASDKTITVPAVDGTMLTTASTFAGTGPAFSAYLNTTQSVANTVFTKLQAGVEEFDTNSNYDNVTNYRFTPTVPGYYQINGQIYFGASSSITVALITIYKNGSRFKDGNYMQAPGPNMFATVNALIYLNGTTDYLELYGLPTGTGSLAYSNNAPTLSYFQGYLARAA